MWKAGAGSSLEGSLTTPRCSCSTGCKTTAFRAAAALGEQLPALWSRTSQAFGAAPQHRLELNITQ